MNASLRGKLIIVATVATGLAIIFAPEDDVKPTPQLTNTSKKVQSLSITSSPEPKPSKTLALSPRTGEKSVTVDLFKIDEPPENKSKKKEKPVAPPLPYVYMGKMIDNKNQTVFLTRNEKPYVVHSGDLLDGTYRIDSIEPPSMEITYLPLNEKQYLNIGANK